MQLDLALFLRLSRTLEGTTVEAQVALDDHAAVLSALDRFLLSVNEQTELLRPRDTAPAAAAIQVELEESHEIPPIPEEAALPPELEEELPPQVWTRQHDLLYEDVLWLFRIGDNEGALVSLGRLLAVAADTQELQRFLEINESKLVSLYERMLGSFQLPLAVSDDGVGDRYFIRPQEAQALLRLGKECDNLAQLLDRTATPRMQALALVHRLHSEGLLSVQAGEKRESVH
ncbi:MAG: hypothetical protein FJ109_05190 [Deltaproteobacteria bacterium]|nr:hypothetical protein [Deltaproteobacteria bacterium]